MTLPVPIDALAEELDCLPEEARVYVSRETGEFLTVLNSDMGVIEEGDETDGFEWEWSPEDVAKLREIAERDGKWIAMPDKFEIHEWTFMEAFADQQREPLSSNLQNAIRGRGAFRAFRAVLESVGRTEAWYQFKHDHLVELASATLREHNVPFKRGRS